MEPKSKGGFRFVMTLAIVALLFWLVMTAPNLWHMWTHMS